MDFRIVNLLFLALFALLVTGARGQPECQAWKNVSDIVKRLDPLNVTCSVYQPCTGIECSGIMAFPGLSEDVHFAVSFVPCSDPLQFKVVIDIPPQPSFNKILNISKTQVINETYPLPGLTRKLDGISTEGNITVVLSSSLSASGMPLITAEINVTVKATMDMKTYLPTFVLIPNVTFPIPECSLQTPPTLSVASDTLNNNATPELTGGSCSASSLENPCKGKYQMCNEGGYCVCFHGYSWNEAAKQCEVPSLKSKADGGPAAWIVAVATIATVFALAGFVIFLVYKFRRNQDRYRHHTLLINNDNDADLDDPDPPMLTG